MTQICHTRMCNTKCRERVKSKCWSECVSSKKRHKLQKHARGLEPIKDVLVEWFKHRFLSDWSWRQHFAAAQTLQYTSEEDAGLLLQSLVAVSARSCQFLDSVMPAFDLAARRGVNSPVVDPAAAAATPIQSMEQEPTTPINRDT